MSETTNTYPDRAAPARAEHQRRAALRAIADHRKVDRAARIVQAALENDVLTDEVRRLVDQAVDQGHPEKVADPGVLAKVAAAAGRGVPDASA